MMLLFVVAPLTMVAPVPFKKTSKRFFFLHVFHRDSKKNINKQGSIVLWTSRRHMQMSVKKNKTKTRLAGDKKHLVFVREYNHTVIFM